MDINNRTQYLIDNGYKFNFEQYLSSGFNLIGKNFGAFMGMGGVFLLCIVCFAIPFVGWLAFPICMPAMTAGFYSVVAKIDRGESISFSDYFSGFSNFGNLFVAGLLVGILTMLGFILLYIPGIYLAVSYSFVFILLTNNPGMGAWDAMEASRKIIGKNFWWMLLFGMVVGLMSELGIILCYIGIVFTLPAMYIFFYMAYKDIVGLPGGGAAESVLGDDNILDAPIAGSEPDAADAAGAASDTPEPDPGNKDH